MKKIMLCMMTIMFLTGLASANINISAVQFNAPGIDTEQNINEEWVKIINTGNDPVDMTGWKLIDKANHGSNRFPFENLSLFSEATVTVHTGNGTSNDTDRYLGYDIHIWNNEGDNATLKDNNGTIIDQKSCEPTNSDVEYCQYIDIAPSLSTPIETPNITTTPAENVTPEATIETPIGNVAPTETIEIPIETPIGNVAPTETIEIPIETPIGNVAPTETWEVKAGGQTKNMAIQGMAFYPGIIIINAGDTVKWTIEGNLHTISFLSGKAAPPEGSPEFFGPSGGSEYNGTGFVSSGILPTEGNYSLKFTEPGVFDYVCLIHPGMQGVVIVQPAGSDYPLSQEEYNNRGQRDLYRDLNVGIEMTKQVRNMITSSPGENDTTNWQTFMDIPIEERVKVRIRQMNDSNVKGRAVLNMADSANLHVKLDLTGLEQDSENSANINVGTCNIQGSTVFTIGNFNADSNRDALVERNINVTPPFGIRNRGWIIDVKNNDASIACGRVVKHDAARMRFATRTLEIDQGDTVMWTQLNPMEIHTVSFLAENQTSPEILLPGFKINPEVAEPSGSDEYNGTGYFNSGILVPEASYNLTFSEPGRFRYECVLHDESRMVGYIDVNPRAEE